MRVLVATSTYPLASHEYWGNFIIDLNRRLEREGIATITLAPKCRCNNRQYLTESGLTTDEFDFFIPRRVQILGCPPGMEFNSRTLGGKFQLPFYLFFFALNLLKAALKRKPNLIHANWAIPAGLVSLFVGRLTNVPVLVTSHGADVYQRGIRKAIIKLVLDHADHVVAVSNHVKRLLLGFAGPKKLTVVPNAVDAEKILHCRENANISDIKNEFGISADQKVVLTVRRLVPEKRLQDLVLAAPLVVKDTPNVKFVIAGDGPELGNLRALATEKHASDHILFLGGITEDQKMKLLSIADVTVQTSVQEGLSIALLEFMAAKTIVVASSSAGQSDIIVDGQTGLLFTATRIDELSKKIVHALTQPDLNPIRERASSLVLKEHSFGVQTEHYIDVYRRVISRT